MRRGRFLWADGRSEVRDCGEPDEISLAGPDGRSRLFTATGRTDAAGLSIWIEESRQWERMHNNGRRSLVYQHADVDPGLYSAGAPLRGAAEGFTLGIAALDRAQAIADQASGCPQPCACPPWAESV